MLFPRIFHVLASVAPREAGTGLFNALLPQLLAIGVFYEVLVIWW